MATLVGQCLASHSSQDGKAAQGWDAGGQLWCVPALKQLHFST